MPMHPYMYSRNLIGQSSALRSNRDRPIQVLFAGSRGASHPLLSRSFDVIPREDVLRHIQSGRVTYTLLASPHELEASHPDRILLAIREVCEIPQEDLLHAISRSRFFLALPGWIMPPAHNLTECMAVGAIPILQYASLLPQPLTEGLNCLVYRTLSELENAISVALNMPPADAEKMSRSVLEYYDANLSPAAVAATLRDCTSPAISLVAEEASVLLLQ